ncbi:hypothetical protein HY638_01105 [Candidatus Woesearchaeota archaeon]|nr:hypothetical protein [Candidatus Woesearchaeota archaeon]
MVNEYSQLIKSIGKALEEGRRQVVRTVNNILVTTYWEIGKRIVEFEKQTGKKSAYGEKLFERIAKDLRMMYGKGFSRSNIIYMRLIYLEYPKSQTLSDQLTWSHYIELLGIDYSLERRFYEKQCMLENWSDTRRDASSKGRSENASI